MQKIGIFGGSFDPVHNDHIKIAAEFADRLNLDKVYVVPAYSSPYKNGTKASGDDRYNMLSIALSHLNDDRFFVDNCELQRGGISYTLDTLKMFSERFPHDKLFFLVGADSLKDFSSWHEPEKILSLATLTAASRANDNALEYADKITDKFGVSPIILTDGGGACSSSLIREYIALGLDVSAFLDNGVYDYIKKNNLYNGGKFSLYYEYMKNHSSEKRLIHTAGVIVCSEKYAKRLGADVDKAHIAALLHDCAKYTDAKSVSGFSLPQGVPQPVEHQFLGAYIAEKALGVKDADILNAIRWHTTGRPNMFDMERIVYTADLLEPSRCYNGVDELRKAVDADFDKGFELCVRRMYEYIKKDSERVYMSDKTYDYYCKNQ